MTRTFDQRYPDFLVGHSTQDVYFGTLLPGFSTIEKLSWAGTFGNFHEMDIELKKTRTQLPAGIFLEFRGRMQILARMLLESSYNFMTTVLINTDADISIVSCQGFSEKKFFPSYTTR